MKMTISGLCFASLAVTLGALTGCGSSSAPYTTTPPITEVNNCKTTNTTSPAKPTPTANYAGTPFSGTVLAGTTPLSGAKVQLYAAGTAGNGSAGTALLGTALTTGANGAFTVPAYTCPLSNSVVYAIATGGATTPTGTANAASELAVVMGTCNGIGSASVVIDEATTVATAFAMQQFVGTGGLGSGAKLGATATNASGISLAAATAQNLVNSATGQAPGAAFPSTGTAPVARLNTLANLLHACVVGGASSTSCTQLETATAASGTAPSNTLDAMVNLAKQPGTNVGQLYTLATSATAYTPSMTSAPADWMLPVIFGGGGMDAPSAISIDSTGTVWVANYFNNASAFTNTGVPVFASGVSDGNINSAYGGAVNVNDEFWVTNEESHYSLDTGFGSVSPFNKSGAVGTFGGGGMYFPIAAAFDTSGVGWIVDYGDSSMSLFSLAKTSVAGTSGYQSSHLAFPVAVATDADCNAYVANQGTSTITRVAADGSSYVDFTVGSGPSGVAIDSAGNVWSANYYGNNVGLVTGGTTVASGAGFTAGGIDHPQGIAADGAGTVWVANFRAPGFTELAGAGTSTPGAGLSPSTGWAPDSGNNTPFALAIDASGNVWMSNFNGNVLYEFVGIAVPVQTPLLGPVRVP
jgi:streptogramin lyase